MATTYAELLTEVAGYLNRADLTAMIPTFVALAHSKFNLELRVRDMQTRAEATTQAEYIVVPEDYLAPYSMELNEPDGWGEPLVFITEEEAKKYRNAGVTGATKWYTIFGDAFELVPTPPDNTLLKLKYYAAIPALSDSNASNWLLAKAPGAYLYGALLEATPYLKNDERIAVWSAARDQIINLLALDDQRARFPQGKLTATRRSFG